MTLPTFDPGFSTARTRAAFSAERRVRAMLEVEAALARAQAGAGLIGPEAAAAIGAACASLAVDPVALLEEGWEVGTVALPLLAALRRVLPPEVAPLAHLGATTQDIVDTALMLQARDGLDALGADLDRAASLCRALASDHRDTPAQGRTFLQPAVATTFGHRAAQWCVRAVEARARLGEARRALPLQLGGPVGHAGGMGENAERVRGELATALGLRNPAMAWHTDRQPIHDLVASLTCACGAAAKIAVDVAVLAQAELGEVHVRGGASSSMPHKSNPVDAMRALAAAEACRGVASVVTRGWPQALERGFGAWHAESFAVPLAFHAAGAALEAAARCLEGLEPDPERMAANLRVPAGADVQAAAAEVDRVLGRVR